jgi:mono/diheme cytochrome c family protein
MNRKALLPAMALALAMAGASSALAGSKRIELPADGVVLKPSTLPGYAKAQAQCAACHSAEYMQYQPATAPRAYWDAMARRMKSVFNAPIADEDIPLIVEYLTRTYGNEQTR